MAVTATKVGSELKITMVVGIDSKGKDKIGTKTIGDIEVDAPDESVYAIAKAIAAIKAYPLIDIYKEDKMSITNENA
jgi:uncharacterized protein DUF1659